MMLRLLPVLLACSALLSFCDASRYRTHSPEEVDSLSAHRQGSGYVPNTFIVEFSDQHVGNTGSVKNLVNSLTLHLNSHQDFRTETIDHHQEPHFFHGATLRVHPSSVSHSSKRQVQYHIVKDHFETHPAIVAVYQIPRVHPRSRRGSSGPARLGHRDLHHPRSNITERSDQQQQKSLADHVSHGIDIQHQRGNLGKGVDICVLDFPIDVTHPDFGSKDGKPCIGEPHCAVTRGFDFSSAKSPDDQPRPFSQMSIHKDPECGHASHISGIAASRGTLTPGVAPEAHLKSFILTTCPYGDSDDIAQFLPRLASAFATAKRECDVLLFSGGDTNGFYTIHDTLADRLAQAGVVVAISAGNGGVSGGLFDGSTPANAKQVISVGASSPRNLYAWPATIEPPLEDGTNEILLRVSTAWNFEDPSLPSMPLWFTPAALKDPTLTDDGCDALPKDTPDLSGHIVVLFEPEDCYRSTAKDTVKARGGKFVIFIPAKGSEPYDGYTPDLGGVQDAGVDYETGMKLYHYYKSHSSSSNSNIQLKFTSASIEFRPIPHKHGQLEDYSSWGPTNDGDLKPDLLATGYALSTLPLPWKYGIEYGTSMSAPYVAGAAALYLAAKKKDKLTANPTVRDALIHTAQPVHDGDGFLSAFQQGTGVFNVTSAIDTLMELSPTRLNLRGASENGDVYQIEIKNTAEEANDLSLSHRPAKSLLLLRAGKPNPLRMEIKWNDSPLESKESAEVTFDPASFTLAAGETKTINVKFNRPRANPQINLFSGYLEVDNGHHTARMAYGGFAGSLASISPLVYLGFPSLRSIRPALITADFFTLVANDSTIFSLKDEATQPAINYDLQTPSRRVLCDLVDADTKYKATMPVWEWGQPEPKVVHNKAKGVHVDDAVSIIGRIDRLDDATRASIVDGESVICTFEGVVHDLKVGHSVQVPDGRYRMLIRAHRWHSGSLDLEENYESYLSHAFIVKRKTKGKGNGTNGKKVDP